MVAILGAANHPVNTKKALVGKALDGHLPFCTWRRSCLYAVAQQDGEDNLVPGIGDGQWAKFGERVFVPG